MRPESPPLKEKKKGKKKKQQNRFIQILVIQYTQFYFVIISGAGI